MPNYYQKAINAAFYANPVKLQKLIDEGHFPARLLEDTCLLTRPFPIWRIPQCWEDAIGDVSHWSKPVQYLIADFKARVFQVKEILRSSLLTISSTRTISLPLGLTNRLRRHFGLIPLRMHTKMGLVPLTRNFTMRAFSLTLHALKSCSNMGQIQTSLWKNTTCIYMTGLQPKPLFWRLN